MPGSDINRGTTDIGPTSLLTFDPTTNTVNVKAANLTVNGSPVGGGGSSSSVALSYSAGWADRGVSYEPGRYWVDGNVVSLAGQVMATSAYDYASLNRIIATLPSGARPAKQVMVGVMGDTPSSPGTTTFLEINTTGTIRIAGIHVGSDPYESGESGTWFSLNGIRFRID